MPTVLGNIGNGINSILGGSPNNSGFTASGTNILTPTTSDQANTAYGNTTNALLQQQQLAQALAANQGVGNQQQVFNQGQQLYGQMGQGVSNQNQMYNNMGNLATTLQNQAAGIGPNPAQQALAQNTGVNMANQAALMAGQRGAGQNVGLMARQNAQQGAATQQASIGQAATLQAQQQIAAQQQLAAQQAQMAGLANTQVSQQQAQQLAGANIAQQQIANQQAANMGQSQSALQGQSNILGGIGAQNQANVGMQSNLNNANAGMAQSNSANTMTGIGSLLNGAGTAGAFLYNNLGTKVPSSAIAGDPASANLLPSSEVFNEANTGYTEAGNPVSAASLPSSEVFAGDAATQAGGLETANIAATDAIGAGAADAGLADVGTDLLDLAMFASKGALIPGQAKIKGDSPENDTVPAMLSPGEIVIPRHVLQSADPIGASAHFVESLINQQHGSTDNFKEALKSAMSSRKPEGKCNGGVMGYSDGGQAPSPDFYQSMIQGALPGNQMAVPTPASPLMSFPKQQAAPEPSATANLPELGGGNTQQVQPMGTSGLDIQMAAQKGLGEAIGKEGAQEASAIEQTELDPDMQKTALDVAADHKAAQDQAYKDYANSTIDPNRIWKNSDTASKISVGIGLLLSGFGSGMAHTQNGALQLVENAVDRDMAAQKADQSKKENLYKINREQLGDDQAALAKTKADAYTALQWQIQKAASQFKGPIAQQQAKLAIGQLQQQKDQFNNMLGLHAGLTGQIGDGTEGQFNQYLQAAQVSAPTMAKEALDHYIPGTGISTIAATPEDRDSIRDFSMLNKTLNEARDFQKNTAGLESSVWPGELKGQAAAIRANLDASAGRLQKNNRLSPQVLELYKEQVGNVGSIDFLGNTKGRLDELNRQVINEQQSELNKLGVKKFRTPPINKTAMEWAKANPNDPRSKQIIQKLGAQ